VAPWLSPRTRELLAARDFAYLDLTGNVLLRLARPAVYLRLEGAHNNPTGAQARGPATLKGARAGRLIRLLADVRPPYRLTELARAADLNPGYVSRLLNTLSEQALLRRVRGVVRHVDWPSLLRSRAESYDSLRSGKVHQFVAPRGARAAYEQLPVVSSQPGTRLIVTGSFAAHAVAPVAAPVQLLAYSTEPEQHAQSLGLLPTETGGDVLLITPADEGQMMRPRIVGDVLHVAHSQLVLDCLSGGGRLPAEGEAVLDWMIANESLWRLPSLAEIPSASGPSSSSVAGGGAG
jgi:hypothetical protein